MALHQKKFLMTIYFDALYEVLNMLLNLFLGDHHVCLADVSILYRALLSNQSVTGPGHPLRIDYIHGRFWVGNLNVCWAEPLFR